VFYLVSERIFAGIGSATFDKSVGAVVAEPGHEKLFVCIVDRLFQLLVVELWVVHQGLEFLHLILIQLCVILRLLQRRLVIFGCFSSIDYYYSAVIVLYFFAYRPLTVILLKCLPNFLIK